MKKLPEIKVELPQGDTFIFKSIEEFTSWLRKQISNHTPRNNVFPYEICERFSERYSDNFAEEIGEILWNTWSNFIIIDPKKIIK